MTDHTELRKLAEAAMPKPVGNMTEYRENHKQWTSTYEARVALSAACTPATILSLLDRLEKAEKDAERYRWIAKQDHKDRQWVKTYDEFKAARDKKIDAAMEASK